MSVNTAADDHIREVRKNIAEALKHLNAILVEGCWGSDELSKEYHGTLIEANTQLLKMKRDV